MGLREVITTQAELLKRWQTPQGQAIVQGLCAKTNSDAKAGYKKIQLELLKADPVLVTPDICDLIEFGERSFPNKFTLKMEDIPLHYGFLMFEKPLWLPTMPNSEGFASTGGKISLQYVVWGIEKFKHLETGVAKDVLWYTFYIDDPLHDSNLGVFHSSGWEIGTNEDYYKEILRFEGTSHAPEMARTVDLATRYLMCFFRFISTKVIEGKIEGIKNKSARRAIQNGPLRRIPDIHVVRLREVELQGGDPGDETPSEGRVVHWSHRWPVKSHWHNYYYKTTNEHRPLWVDSYVKGPEDKPLVVKKRAIKVDR